MSINNYLSSINYLYYINSYYPIYLDILVVYLHSIYVYSYNLLLLLLHLIILFYLYLYFYF